MEPVGLAIITGVCPGFFPVGVKKNSLMKSKLGKKCCLAVPKGMSWWQELEAGLAVRKAPQRKQKG